MVNLVTNRTIEMTKLAMDGLMLRQKAIMANTANVTTPGYQRKEVSFEGQLKEIAAKDDVQQYIRGQNSIQYNPTSLEMAAPTSEMKTSLTSQQAQYLQSDIYGNYNPQVTEDSVSGSDSSGNNVNMEKEVMDMASVGLKYTALSTLEAKQLKIIASAIKGDITS